MDEEKWLVGWRKIGKYVGQSAKTAQLWAREGMPFFRDDGGRSIAKPSQIDRWILRFNQYTYDQKLWKDKGIGVVLAEEAEKEKDEKDFNERFIAAQRPPRSRF
jgi:hypothetical protein